jgi:pyridoxamine 5'-phosphate oxidase
MTINPLEKLDRWLKEERSRGNPFAHGAVLGTQGEDRMPHTRMIGVSFNDQKIPKFHTSPVSRKVHDINLCNLASLTFAFQQTMRSVSLEGLLEPLTDEELDADWNKLDREFCRNYLIFGPRSGLKIDTLQELRIQQDRLPSNAEDHRPASFIGYTFQLIQQICFYSVAVQDFANCELYEFNPVTQSWISSLRVP